MRCERCKALQLDDYECGVYDCIIEVSYRRKGEYINGFRY